MDRDYCVDSESAMNIDDSELDEVWDDIKMSEHCDTIEKSQLFDSEDDDQLYDLCVIAEKTESQSLRPSLSTSSTLSPVQIGLGNMIKINIESEDGNKDVRRPRVEELSTSTETDKMFINTSKVSKRENTNKKWITEEEYKKVFPRGYRECNFFSSPVEFWVMSKEACWNWKQTALIDLKLNLQKNQQQPSLIGHSSDTEVFTQLLNLNNKDLKTKIRHKKTSINHNVDVLLKKISYLKNCYTCNNVCKCTGLLNNRLKNPSRKNNCGTETVALLSKAQLVFPEIQLIDNFDKFSIKTLSNYIHNNDHVNVTNIAKPNISQSSYDMFENQSDTEREKMSYENNIILLQDTPNSNSIQSSSTSSLDSRYFVTERDPEQIIQDESTTNENNEYFENVLKYFHLNSISNIFQDIFQDF